MGADFSAIVKRLNGLEKVLKQDAKHIIGVEAVNHFTENFDKQSFEGKKWKEVKRRDSSSVWSGFKYGSKTAKPDNHPSRKGSSRKYKPRKSGAITNYSPTATKTPILSSQKSELENSIKYKTTGNRVIVYSDKPYADVHNEGGKIKVFGKATATVPKRQFIGNSRALQQRIINKIIKKLKIYL